MNKTGPLSSMVAVIYGSCLRHLQVALLVCPGITPFAFPHGFTPGYKMFRACLQQAGLRHLQVALLVCPGIAPFAFAHGFIPGYEMYDTV